MDFSKLKSNRTDFQKLTKAIDSINSPAEGSKDDDRFWQPEVDKAGNGMAIIRFLPAPAVDGDDALPWARIQKTKVKSNCISLVRKSLIS